MENLSLLFPKVSRACAKFENNLLCVINHAELNIKRDIPTMDTQLFKASKCSCNMSVIAILAQEELMSYTIKWLDSSSCQTSWVPRKGPYHHLPSSPLPLYKQVDSFYSNFLRILLRSNMNPSCIYSVRQKNMNAWHFALSTYQEWKTYYCSFGVMSNWPSLVNYSSFWYWCFMV